MKLPKAFPHIETEVGGKLLKSDQVLNRDLHTLGLELKSGLIARLANLMPATVVNLGPAFTTQGKKKQASLKALRDGK